MEELWTLNKDWNTIPYCKNLQQRDLLLLYYLPNAYWGTLIFTVLCAAFLQLFRAHVPNVQTVGAYEAQKRLSPQLIKGRCCRHRAPSPCLPCFRWGFRHRAEGLWGQGCRGGLGWRQLSRTNVPAQKWLRLTCWLGKKLWQIYILKKLIKILADVKGREGVTSPQLPVSISQPALPSALAADGRRSPPPPRRPSLNMAAAALSRGGSREVEGEEAEADVTSACGPAAGQEAAAAARGPRRRRGGCLVTAGPGEWGGSAACTAIRPAVLQDCAGSCSPASFGPIRTARAWPREKAVTSRREPGLKWRTRGEACLETSRTKSVLKLCSCFVSSCQRVWWGRLRVCQHNAFLRFVALLFLLITDWEHVDFHWCGFPACFGHFMQLSPQLHHGGGRRVPAEALRAGQKDHHCHLRAAAGLCHWGGCFCGRSVFSLTWGPVHCFALTLW